MKGLCISQTLCSLEACERSEPEMGSGRADRDVEEEEVAPCHSCS